jgi:hydroxysqualene dehydroxylase
VTRPTVAVIGGGWAGCAAAVALADEGFDVELVEAASVLGGRARRVERDGLSLDNGQHLMLGAYRDTLDLMAHVGAPAPVHAALAIAPLVTTQSNAIAFRARRLPAPLGLAAGVACARGMDLRARVALLRWFAALRRSGFLTAAATVAEMTATLPAAAMHLLHPLCLAALNTPPQAASAQVFANVLRAAFGGAGDAADRLVTAGDLSALLPDAAGRWLAARGHRVTCGATARVAAIGAANVALEVDGAPRSFAAAVVAVGPHQLHHALTADLAAREPVLARALACVDALDWEPIATVYFGYAAKLALPAALIRLDDAPAQWLFARDDILAAAAPEAPRIATLVAAVISARGAHDGLGSGALVAAIDAQLRRLRPAWPAPTWSQAIVEKRATYACTPHAQRPVAGLVAPRLALAGDYTDDLFPATLEAAVRSGRRAAAALAKSLRAAG